MTVEVADFIQSICGWGFGTGYDRGYTLEASADPNRRFNEAIAQANKFKKLGVLDELIEDEASAFKDMVKRRF